MRQPSQTEREAHHPVLVRGRAWIRSRLLDPDGEPNAVSIGFVVTTLAAMIAFVASVVAEDAIASDIPPWRVAATLVSLCAVLALRLAWSEPSYKQRELIPDGLRLAAGAAAALLASAFGGSIGILPFVVVMQFGRVFVEYPVLPASLCSVVYAALWLALLRDQFGSTPTFSYAAGVAVAGVITSAITGRMLAAYVQRRRSLAHALAELNTTSALLSETRARERELALEAERARIHDEVHDTVGRALTNMSVQLQVTETLIEEDPAAAAESVRAARRMAREALADVRRSVAPGTPPPLDGRSLPEALQFLATRFAQVRGARAVFRAEGTMIPLDGVAELALYRAAQEALTNVQRHSRATLVCLTLTYSPTEVSLLVRDDGGTSSSRRNPDDAGSGLARLRSRVERLGGTMHAEQWAQGFELQVVVPTAGRQTRR
jgi:signal transduction histidine kinase